MPFTLPTAFGHRSGHIRFQRGRFDRLMQTAAMSALTLKADICTAQAHVCFGPKADIALTIRSPRRHGKRRPVEGYSIPSLASVCKVIGTFSPSVLAVRKLITKSELVLRITGKSAGFSPLRMRAT